MPKQKTYIMEHTDEAYRLDVKTDPKDIRRQARWCGLKPGMRVLDVGCGPGKITSILHQIVQPGGSAVGIDCSENRVDYAKKHYGHVPGIAFFTRDFIKTFEDLGTFDIIWIRFVLEYYRKEAPSIVENLKKYLNPGGWLCLIDLDNNCLCHHEIPSEMEEMLQKMMKYMETNFNFDPYVGRKLYSYLYDAGFADINVNLQAHHLFYGKMDKINLFDWMKKLEVNAPRLSKFFKDYQGGYASFQEDFQKFFISERRFTYTPLILCKGRKTNKD